MTIVTSKERKARALAEANKILLPLLGGARHIAKVVEASGAAHVVKPVSVHSSSDMRLHIVVIDIPGSSPLVVAIYVSTQESRPTSPSQFSTRIKRLQHFLDKLRGKYFNTADVAYLYISPLGLTRGAKRLAIKSRIFYAANGNEAKQKLANFLATRYKKLLAKLTGKRIWGTVPLLLYALSLLARRLGAVVQSISPIHAIEWAQKGTRLTNEIISNTIHDTF
ncbi:hypothetical protein Pyrde_1620 [Pyrodictium delaneyi]|uniref:Uncharacterized protein n=1 Tax=Pyrodictium delaneyi TaxID=1273541 RepID=A0A0P0N5G6_9CREN|nr:hypothetical protein [Pyrodictium delaneyi]ALL01663.1 hypothetical protein Pyrde_1620 [Pyrodictium delaneyi]OWJ55104.1 hypothetical protein Pdsh_05320 [Pyrodictium delaneyi]